MFKVFYKFGSHDHEVFTDFMGELFDILVDLLPFKLFV